MDFHRQLTGIVTNRIKPQEAQWRRISWRVAA
jgi:hypothetical protein